MIALGLCPCAEAGALAHRTTGRIAVLMAEGTAQDRLQRCIEMGQELEAFLPFSPRDAPALEEACNWAARNEARLLAGLQHVAGHAEMIVTLDIPEPPAREARTGRGWLADRQARHRRRQEAEQALRAVLPEAEYFPPSGKSTVIEGIVLIPTSQLAARAATLAKALEAGVKFRISGPWPAFHFAGKLSAIERGAVT